MNSRTVKTDFEQVVRTLLHSFTLINFGVQPKYIYLPTDLYDHFTDHIEDELLRACRLTGTPEPNLDEAFRYFYQGAEVLEARTNDILVTAELLP